MLFNAGKQRRQMASEQEEETVSDETGKVSGLPLLHRTITEQGYLNLASLDAQAAHELSKRAMAVDAPKQTLFDTQNCEAVSRRDEIATATLDKMCRWLASDDSHRIGIFDATNTTRSRRRLIIDTISRFGSGYQVLFLESICNDEAVINRNILHKVYRSPDYMHVEDKAWCNLDFQSRLRNYEKVYEKCDVAAEFAIKADNIAGIGCLKVIDLGLTLQLQGHTSRRCEGELMCMLHNLYHRTVSTETFSRARSFTFTRSSCSSSSSSLFSIPSLLLTNQELEFDTVSRAELEDDDGQPLEYSSLRQRKTSM